MNSALGFSDPHGDTFYASKLQSIRDKHLKTTTESSLSHNNPSKAQLDELLRCIICFGKVKNPQMCPSCSKLCCNPCIKKWLTEKKSQCPHCHCPLRTSQLVNCRFVSELTTAIDQLHTKRGDEEETCSIHHAKLSYYCKTCETPICADCAMFGTDHKNHEFEHISKVYDSHVDLVKNEAQGLKKRLKELTTHLTLLESTIEKVTRAKEEKATELGVVLEQMNQRLDAELKTKLLALLAQKGSITDEIELLESMQSDINRQIMQSPKSSLIARSYEMIKVLKEINSKPLTKYNKNTVTPEFRSEIVPQYDSATFYLRPYSLLRQNTEVIYSEPLQANGLTWRLKVYPNGNGVAKGVFLSVFLEMLKGLQDSSKYEYKVEMINQRDPDALVLREFASEFETGECWGYNRFFKIDLLEKDGYLIPEEDTIVLKYYVRAPSYYQQCQDQKKYIQHLERLKNQSNTTIAELKDKLNSEIDKNRKLTEANPSLMSTVRNSISPEKVEERNEDQEVNVKFSQKSPSEMEAEPQKEDSFIKNDVDQNDQISDEVQEGEEEKQEDEENEDILDSDQEGFIQTTNGDLPTTEKIPNLKQSNSDKKTNKEARKSVSSLQEESKLQDPFENNFEGGGLGFSSEKLNTFFDSQPYSGLLAVMENEDKDLMKKTFNDVPKAESKEDSQLKSLNNSSQESSVSLDELCEKVHADLEAVNSLQPIAIENIFNIKNGQDNQTKRVIKNLLPSFEAEYSLEDLEKTAEKNKLTAKSLQLSDSMKKKLENLSNYQIKDRGHDKIEKRRFTPTGLVGPKTERINETDKENSMSMMQDTRGSYFAKKK